MKQIRHIFLIILCALAYATGVWAWGENTSPNVLSEGTNEVYIMTSGSVSQDKVYRLWGPGKKLTFQWKKRTYISVPTGNYVITAYTSTDGSGDGTELESFSAYVYATSWQDKSIDLTKFKNYTSFRSIRFHAGGTEAKIIRSATVTRETVFSILTSEIDFEEVKKNVTSSEDATIVYSNSTYYHQITGICKDANNSTLSDFTVTTDTVGIDNTKNIKINFKPTKVGYQEGTITLTSTIGKSVSFKVKGTGITTYYVSSSVTAVPSAGGNAFTSFTTANPTSGSTAIKNSGDVSTAYATTYVYFNAVPNSNYVFKGWTASTATSYNSVSPVSSITYNSENSSSPTSIAYKAWFAPLCNFSATALVGNVAGGTVKVSAGNTILENATTTATANGIEGAPGETSASTTFTFSATPAQGYKFVGWGTTPGAITYESTNATYSKLVTNNSPGSTEPTTLYAIFKLVHLHLDPSNPSYVADTYDAVSLDRSLPAGYSSIALPFGTTVGAIVGGGYNSTNDWVAQLTTVTYNAQDDYTLYFTKSNGGAIAANQPYVLHLGTEVVSPSWTDLTVNAPAATTKTPTGYGTAVSPFGDAASDWSMSSNFTAGMSMNGKYGIVNTGANNQNGQGGLKLGGSGSTLNAFSAYVTPPASVLSGNKPLRIRAAYVDPDGTITYIDSPTTDVVGEAQQKPVAIYGSDGQRRPHMQRGLNIVRYADGTTRKVMY